MSKALYTLVYSAFFIVCNGCIVSAEAVILYLLVIISMKCERLLDGRFMVLKHQYAREGVKRRVSRAFVVLWYIYITCA